MSDMTLVEWLAKREQTKREIANPKWTHRPKGCMNCQLVRCTVAFLAGWFLCQKCHATEVARIEGRLAPVDSVPAYSGQRFAGASDRQYHGNLARND